MNLVKLGRGMFARDGERVGRVVDDERGTVLLKPVTGGQVWPARSADVQVIPPSEGLRDAVRRENWAADCNEAVLR
ncbi:hypothetical protein GCM10027168_17910 [Streptomyces capparidis]